MHGLTDLFFYQLVFDHMVKVKHLDQSVMIHIRLVTLRFPRLR